MNLNIKACALSFAILWELGLFLMTWWVIAFDGTSTDTTLLSRCYRGYSFTAIGSIIGLAWAFLDGLIGGAIFAWLYNCLHSRFVQTAQEN